MVAIVCAFIFYCLYYFLYCRLPIIGIATFRIDYFALTITRADFGLSQVLMHARPISELFLHIQAILAKLFLHDQAKYIIYPLQHLALLVYFFSISKVIESIFKIKLHIFSVLAAWILFITNPAVMPGVYKLETIVGTLSMIFGGLALVFLSKWSSNKRLFSFILFLGLFALSIFAKEDFILPPLFLLAWYLIKDGEWRSNLRENRGILFSIIALLAFFVIFNEFIVPGRSYMDPVNKAQSPYFMTLNPASVIKVAIYYFAGVGLQLKLIGLLYLAATFICILLGRKRKEVILVVLVVGSLMAPYLIMPNHLFSYYGLKWWTWESLALFAILQAIFTKRGYQAAGLAGAILLILALVNINQHRGMNWYESNYFRHQFARSENLQKSLVSNRVAINAQKQVAVIGVGPGQVDQSPWQGNGETEFFLQGDLKLTTQWIVFAKSSDASYTINQDTTKPRELAPKVIVRSINDLGTYGDIPRLTFSPDGTGVFTDVLNPKSQAH